MQRDLETELVEHSGHRLVDQFLDGPWSRVQRRDRGEDGRADLSRRHHEAELAEVQRSLADHEDEGPPLFEIHASRTNDQIVLIGVHDA